MTNAELREAAQKVADECFEWSDRYTSQGVWWDLLKRWHHELRAALAQAEPDAPSFVREGNHVTILTGAEPLAANFVPSHLSKDSGLPTIPPDKPYRAWRQPDPDYPNDAEALWIVSGPGLNAMLPEAQAIAVRDALNGLAAAERGPSETPRDTILRRLLWLRHGCPTLALYGDDGEMSCDMCGIDFKRMEPGEMEAKWHGSD